MSEQIKKSNPVLEILLLAIAALLTLVYFLYTQFDYSNLFVFYHNPLEIVSKVVADGIVFTWQDILEPLKMGLEEGYRPRFFTLAINLVDIKLALPVYSFWLVHPTLSISWVATLIIGPIYFYKLILLATNSKKAGFFGLVIYCSSIGFLSGFTMFLLAGKPMTLVTTILIFYCMAKIEKQEAQPMLLYERRSSYKVLMYAILYLSFFLDEVPLFMFILLPIFFPNLFWLSGINKTQIFRMAKNLFYFFLPLAGFLLIAIFLFSLLTQSVWSHRFDYLEFTGILPPYDLQFILKHLFYHTYQNFMGLFGTAFIPYQISPMATLTGNPIPYYFTQTNAWPKILVFLVVFPLIFYHCFSQPFRKSLLSRLLITTLVFIVLQTLLNSRHAPDANGYYYGNLFSFFFAFFVAVLLHKISLKIKWAASLILVLVVLIQLNNFHHVNQSWVKEHNTYFKSLIEKRDVNNTLVIRDKEPLRRQELLQIHNAWKNNKLALYVKENGISSGAIYLLFYLQNAKAPEL